MYRLDLKDACSRRGMTLSELAERTGIPQPSLSRYISGRRDITLRQLGRLALALDVGIEDLVREDSLTSLFSRQLRAIERTAVKKDKRWVLSSHDNLQRFRASKRRKKHA